MQTENFTTLVVFDIDGVIRDVGNSYRRAIADTVEHFTQGKYRPTMIEIDQLKSEGVWNNDWEASRELVYRYYQSQGQQRQQIALDYNQLVAFFQGKYRGLNPQQWDGYITTEPLLLSIEYLQQLNADQIGWGFFSGATRGSAEYVLKKRLGLTETILVAMEDAPSKPDPTGLFKAIAQLENNNSSLTPVLYVGDTVADMYTITEAQQIQPERLWLGVGVLPPHVLGTSQQTEYSNKLINAGATTVLNNVEKLNANLIQQLISNI
ncbi:HAD superfamily (subfamily IA) hydrolase, TIGR01548 [Stanieria cyanosphaera PCC 7437]|uniref:HAD superfamily (Subfamily IA) hydrolase, TIGR01548 n=1 Tax=Stanieria cyanosphaera (strain ATCC 29371 / PCC 7437) TaxID=111780 RepID=K9XV30_STAC7|nr:TIGR01548 family HAD-type hydrolase [Stanieria cyanosphaera]AFZ36455.1 HAD superfamily (subfamily IA) hydrolase, TIGR01548 [Stanieria cyanosphaera PCC 7437]